jgi:hypothetical protein
MKQSLEVKIGLERLFTFGFLALYTICIWAGFIGFAIGATENEVNYLWLSCYGAVLAYYAARNRLSPGWGGHAKLPGQYFVYISWVLILCMPFARQWGLCGVTRLPANLWSYFAIVTSVFAGSSPGRLKYFLRVLLPRPT